MGILPFTLLGLGFLLGMRHSLEADHIAAMSAITSKYKSVGKSSISGMFWGFGHAVSLFAAGILVLFFKIKISEKFSLFFEFLAGLMLMLLGLNVLMAMGENKMHVHKHKHNGIEHLHFHSHNLMKNHNHQHMPFYIGLLHGLAGSAALALLVLATTTSKLIGLLYILIFGIGSMLGMMLITTAISLPFKFNILKLQKMHQITRISSGLISILIGFTTMTNLI